MKCNANKTISHINRSSTPRQTFKMPFDLRGVTLRVTYQQSGENIITKTNDDMVIEGDRFSFALSQEETRKLEEGTLNIQIKFKLPDDFADYTKTIRARVEDVLDDEVI